jgi:hypothetical protein
LLSDEGLPRRNGRGQNESGREHMAHAPTRLPWLQQHTRHCTQKVGSTWQSEQLRPQESPVAHDDHQAGPGDAIVGIELTESQLEASNRVGDPAPFLGLRRWPLLKGMAGAGTEEGELVRKVSIEGPARHTRLFRDGNGGRVSRPDRVVKRYCRVDDALAGMVLTLGAKVEQILPGDFRDLQCDLILTKLASEAIVTISIQL